MSLGEFKRSRNLFSPSLLSILFMSLLERFDINIREREALSILFMSLGKAENSRAVLQAYPFNSLYESRFTVPM